MPRDRSEHPVPRVLLLLVLALAMARIFYCRYDDCGKPDESVAGEQKATCPACGRDARWTTDPESAKERRKHAKLPRVPFDLNHNDRRFLRSLRIAQE